MRSYTGKIKLALDRAEREKYKTERRIDKMKLYIINLNKVIESYKEQLQETTNVQ